MSMMWILWLSACVLLTCETGAQKTFYECYNITKTARKVWSDNALPRHYPFHTEVTKRCCDGYEKWDGRCVNELYKVCGRSSDISPFTVAGSDATLRKYPWLVQVFVLPPRYVHNHAEFCGGALIDNEWIITAAHCLIFGNIAVRVVEKPDVDQRGIAIDPQSIYVYPDYNSITLDNDIGLIKLSKKVIFNEYVKPICLPDANFTVRMDDEVEIAGWGMTPTEANRRVSRCIPSLRRKKMICVTGEDDVRRQPDFGDTGSPLMLRRNDVTTIIGVDSVVSSGCTSGHPGAYTDVRRYVYWIEFMIENY